jgi:hypothetical protein
MCTFPQSPGASKAVFRRVMHDQRRSRADRDAAQAPPFTSHSGCVAATKNCGGIQHHGQNNNDHKAEREVYEGCERARGSSEVESREARRRHHSCETPCWDTHNLSVSSTCLTPGPCRRTTAVSCRKDASQNCISAMSQTSMSLSPQDMFAVTH